MGRKKGYERLVYDRYVVLYKYRVVGGELVVLTI